MAPSRTATQVAAREALAERKKAAAAVAAGQQAAGDKKKSPLPEFLIFYFGTLAVLLALDQSDVLYPGRNALALFPRHASLPSLLADGTRENVAFMLLGVLLIYPMHLWRGFVKSCFVGLATRGAGLHPATLKYDKFLEQGWLATHYTIVSAVEIYTVATCSPELWPPMMTDKSRLAMIWPQELIAVHHKMFWVRVTYLLQYTFYFMELATLVLDKRSRSRSDAFVYALHHVLTVFLIGLSFVYESAHLGMLVLLFHDVGDVFLPISKCFVYAEDHVRATKSRRTFKQLEAAGVFFFICFLVSFGVLRLVLLPIMIYTGVYEGAWYSRDYIPARDGPSPRDQSPEQWGFSEHPATFARPVKFVALLLLLPMHVYWFRLALRVAYRAVMGIYDDERSDDDEYDNGAKKAR